MNVENINRLEWGEYFDELITLTTDVQNRSGLPEDSELLADRLQVAIESLHQVYSCVDIAKNDIENIILEFQVLIQVLNRECHPHNDYQSRLAVYQVSTNKATCERDVGRPKYLIPEELLLSFRQIGYTWKEIAAMLLVSRWTVMRRVNELGIRDLTGYSEISNEELDQLIITFRQHHGSYAGRLLVTGHLKSLGIRVQHWRIREALIRVDPAGSRIRWACLIRRRKYSVPGPNSLWHMDGHHSLITWGFVVHGIIDGFSRMIVGLKCATNNKKETVALLFREATDNFGLPSRVRTDKGGENVLVWEIMEQLRGPNRGSFLASTSTRNQRIERLWRDVWMYVCHIFYYTFQGMEAEGMLHLGIQMRKFGKFWAQSLVDTILSEIIFVA